MKDYPEMCDCCTPRDFFGLTRRDDPRLVLDDPGNKPDINGVVHDPMYHEPWCPRVMEQELARR